MAPTQHSHQNRQPSESTVATSPGNSTQHCEIIVESTPLSGTQNMQVDESLLQAVSNRAGHSFVRIYQWNEPTVSLGYFQNIEQFPAGRLSACPRVRRLSGGGAILHDKEVTYSVALPADHSMRKSPVQLYERVHLEIIALLRQLGVEKCDLRMNAAMTRPPIHNSDDQFLCFQRTDPRDVVINGTKIIGSAQRRRKGNILQHGSILLRASSFAPEVRGLMDLNPKFPLESFLMRLPKAVAKGIEPRPLEPSRK